MPCLIPPCWSRRPARTTWHSDNKFTNTKPTAISPHFLRTSQTTNQLRSREYQQGVGRRNLDNKMGHTHCLLRKFIHTPSSKHICHDLTRHSLVRLDRLRKGYGRFKYNIYLMGLAPSASYTCGTASQTAHHIASECPLHGSSVVECRTHNQVSPGSNPPLLPFRRLGIFVLSIDAPVHSAV